MLIFLLNLRGLYDFLIALQKNFLLCLSLLVFGSSFYIPPVKFPLHLASCVWGVLFPYSTSSIWHNRVRDMKNACSIISSAYAVRERGARKSPREVPAFPEDHSCQEVLQRSVWEGSLYLQPGQRWNSLSDKEGRKEVALSCDLKQAIRAFQSQMCFTPTSCCKMFCLAFTAFSRICFICPVRAFGFIHILLSLKYLFSPSWVLLI